MMLLSPMWSFSGIKGHFQAVRNSTMGPPMVARALAIVHTCIYDAWAAYDNKAVGSQFGGRLRRPRRERTIANKNKAVSLDRKSVV